MNKIKRRLAVGLSMMILSVYMITQIGSISSFANLYDIGNNIYLDVNKTPSGVVGKNMTISLTVKNDPSKNNRNEDLQNVEVAIDRADLSQSYEDEGGTERIFPFEVTSTTFDSKKLGTIQKGSQKTVTFTAKVRQDIKEGYYIVPFEIRINGTTQRSDSINIWISGTANSSTEDKEGGIAFSVGMDQNTPFGTYPDVMNFSVNVKNTSSISAQDVTVRLGLSEDSTKFPFEINEANYDRKYEKIGAGETVVPSYSMAIRENTYSGYYPINMVIHYRDSSDGPLKKAEETFYVNIKNKEKEGGSEGDFNPNNRTKARIIVESFQTIPEEVKAGEEFELLLKMKNASESVSASNILFSFESEKVSDSAVFTTDSGSSSMVINGLSAGQSVELRMKMQAKANIDQRPYSLTIHEKYDSPEFKNAEEKVSIDIFVKQIPRLNTTTMEVVPDSIEAGSESNVMFSINNTGRVLLYNVMVKLEAESIQTIDTYVGNIKPGENGAVDVMVLGKQPTTDDGKVRVLISYEDENGDVFEVEKELTLFVTEDMKSFDDIPTGGMDIDLESELSFWEKNKVTLSIAAVAVLAIVVGVCVFYFKKLKHKDMEEELNEEIEDEISGSIDDEHQ